MWLYVRPLPGMVLGSRIELGGGRRRTKLPDGPWYVANND